MFVHCHQPVKETFAEYANEFSEKISNIAKNYSRVDIVFDDYKHDSLKSFTRKSRGDGRKSKVSPSSKVPKNWKGFLRNSHNKTELFILLAKSTMEIQISVGLRLFFFQIFANPYGLIPHPTIIKFWTFCHSLLLFCALRT